VSPRLCLAFACLVLVGCGAATAPQPRARLDDEGAVYLYLQPLGREAERLRVSVGGVAALRDDGAEVPLSVLLRELTSASLRGEGGESALLVAQAPTRLDFRFTVRRGEGAVLALALRSAEAVEAGFRFSAAFSVYSPERPALSRLGFVANSGSNDVTVFDKKAIEVIDVVATGRGPSGMALDPTGRRLYVALSGDDGVEVVDVLSGKIIDRIRLTPGDEPVDLALTPDGATLLSANRGSNTVSVIDPNARFELMKIPVGNGPRSLVIDHAGRRAFVFNTLSNSVSVIDIRSRTAIRSVPTDPGPIRGDFSRRGDRLYVIHESASYVTVIDPGTLVVQRRFPVRSWMDAIKVDPSTDFVYLAGRGDFFVGVYDPFSFAQVDLVEAGAGIVDMATDRDENALYLVSSSPGRLLVFDRISKRAVGELDVGDHPAWVSVMGEN
jgi:YVTN family beta-propeller protein